MEIQLTLRDTGMQLDAARDSFNAERKECLPDTEALGQLVEDFRDALDDLDAQAQSLRQSLWRMEGMRDQAELSAAAGRAQAR